MTIYYPLLVFSSASFEEHLTFVPCFRRGFRSELRKKNVSKWDD